MQKYYTTSRFGYCLNDKKPPAIDVSAEYYICSFSKGYNRPIIARIDKREYCGNANWIVDEFTLYPIHQKK